MASLAQADADVLGVWCSPIASSSTTTPVTDLSAALEPEHRRRRAAGAHPGVQLSDVLYGAVDVPSVGETTASPSEPSLLAHLRESGFVEYSCPKASTATSCASLVGAPGRGRRRARGVGARRRGLVPVLADLASEGPMPVVATQPTPAVGEDADEPQPSSSSRSAPTTSCATAVDRRQPGHGVRPGRDHPGVGRRRPGDPTIGRYGRGDGADRCCAPGTDDG